MAPYPSTFGRKKRDAGSELQDLMSMNIYGKKRNSNMQSPDSMTEYSVDDSNKRFSNSFYWDFRVSYNLGCLYFLIYSAARWVISVDWYLREIAELLADIMWR